tara:strand:+ start:205 stop:963 length:759 start_codon:yes stop_codon:yes gene_type:complete
MRLPLLHLVFLFIFGTTFAQSINTFLPTGAKGQIVKHQEYTVCYSEEHEQPFWIAYELTKSELELPSRKGQSSFKEDPKISSESAAHSDYTNTGYDRGHISRAEYNKRTKVSYKESYYMSNVSPQIGVNFNRTGGDWYNLEELEKKIATNSGSIYSVSGPIFNDNLEVIGDETAITVPGYFFKAFLSHDKTQAIAFILKHDNVDVNTIWDSAVTINELEGITGFNFFAILPNKTEKEIEYKISLEYWKRLVD